MNFTQKSKNHDTSKEKIPQELLRKIKKIEIRSKVLVNEAISGGYNSIFRGYGMEFQEVREYFPGDDYRMIDWNVTARNLKPYVKRFKEERQMNVMLLIDSSGSMGFGSNKDSKGDKLAETASVIAFTALSNQDKIGAVFFTEQIESVVLPSKNKNTILRLIREIIFLEPESKGTDINNAVDFTIKNMKRRGVIFILSDFYSDIDYKKIFIASKKHDIIPVVFTDKFEEYPVNVGLVDMVDNETGKLVLVDTFSKAYKKMIIERKKRKEEFLNEIKKYNIEPMIIDTSDDIERIIVGYFQRRIKKIRV